MKLTRAGQKRLNLITKILIGLIILLIGYTLWRWWDAERSFEPINVAAFALLSLLTAGLAWLSRQQPVDDTSSPAPISPDVTLPDTGPLRSRMAQVFSLNELRRLSADLGVDWDELGGDSKSDRILNLVEYLRRRGRLDDLLTQLEMKRKNVVWPRPSVATAHQDQNRNNLLRNVRASWIEGFLHQSLQDVVRLELGLTYQLDAVARRTVQPLGQGERDVEKSLRELFDNYGRTLLILGDPGSGKTITLLELTEQLLDEAETDPSRPIPVYVNLSSWALAQPPLTEWLVDVLFGEYQVPQALGKRWVAENRLSYMLDGLDEVSVDVRGACVEAINDFRAQFPAEVVVCSRMADYDALEGKLNLGAAVRIQPLSDDDVANYLARPDLELQAVADALDEDAELRSLAHVPLFLNVMALAYRGMTIEQMAALSDADARRTHLFDHYVARMFERRSLPKNDEYDQSQATHWLRNVAQGMVKSDQSVFFLERLQPSWLVKRQLSFYRLIESIAYGSFAGLFVGGLLVLIFGPLFGFIWPGDFIFLGYIFVYFSVLGFVFELVRSNKQISVYQEMTWNFSSINRRKTLRYCGFALGIGVTTGVALGFVEGFDAEQPVRLALIVMGGLGIGLLGLLFGFMIGIVEVFQPSKTVQKQGNPNLGIKLLFAMVFEWGS